MAHLSTGCTAITFNLAFECRETKFHEALRDHFFEFGILKQMQAHPQIDGE